MPKSIKTAVKKTPKSRLSQKPLSRKLKKRSNFRLKSKRLMLIAFEAIDSPPRQTNAGKRRYLTRIFPDFTSLNLSLFNALNTPKPLTDLERTITTIGMIEKVFVIVAFIA